MSEKQEGEAEGGGGGGGGGGRRRGYCKECSVA